MKKLLSERIKEIKFLDFLLCEKALADIVIFSYFNNFRLKQKIAALRSFAHDNEKSNRS